MNGIQFCPVAPYAVGSLHRKCCNLRTPTVACSEKILVSWDDYSQYMIYIYGTIKFMFQTTNRISDLRFEMFHDFQLFHATLHGYGSKLGTPKLWMVNTKLD